MWWNLRLVYVGRLQEQFIQTKLGFIFFINEAFVRRKIALRSRRYVCVALLKKIPRDNSWLGSAFVRRSLEVAMLWWRKGIHVIWWGAKPLCRHWKQGWFQHFMRGLLPCFLHDCSWDPNMKGRKTHTVGYGKVCAWGMNWSGEYSF